MSFWGAIGGAAIGGLVKGIFGGGSKGASAAERQSAASLSLLARQGEQSRTDAAWAKAQASMRGMKRAKDSSVRGKAPKSPAATGADEIDVINERIAKLYRDARETAKKSTRKG